MEITECIIHSPCGGESGDRCIEAEAINSRVMRGYGLECDKSNSDAFTHWKFIH